MPRTHVPLDFIPETQFSLPLHSSQHLEAAILHQRDEAESRDSHMADISDH